MRYLGHLRTSISWLYIGLLVGILGVSGCALKWVSDYDPVIDQSLTALHKKTEVHWMALEAADQTPDCGHTRYQPFYRQSKIATSALVFRASAVPGNDITIQQIQLLANSFESLEKLHRLSCLSHQQIQVLRAQFNLSFTAILKLELAKRR